MICSRRKYVSEAVAKRCMWAMKQNGRGHDNLTVRYCSVCKAWHIERA